MKANEVPEKVYFSSTEDGTHYYTEGIPSEREYVEYVRKDAFIEKAEKWLSLNLKMLMNVLDVEYGTHETDVKDFVVDFRRYMKVFASIEPDDDAVEHYQTNEYPASKLNRPYERMRWNALENIWRD